MTRIHEVEKKALSAKAIEKMRYGDKDKADISENVGLRVSCGKTGKKSFFYRYRSPVDDSIKQYKIGTYPEMTLAEARLELHRLKVERNSGVCPKTQEDQRKVETLKIEQQKKTLQQQESFTIKKIVDLYLENVIEDRYVEDKRTGAKKRIAGARKPKGQDEARRTLYGDAVRQLGDRVALDVTRQDIVEMVKNIINRGAHVQAGRVLSELALAYEYAIGLEVFPDNFANPAMLAKASLKQARLKLTASKGTRHLDDAELKKVLAWLPVSGFTQKQKHILRIALWTGCRTGEICQAAWKDIDFQKKTWYIRETKNEAARYVQLSQQCMDYISQILESYKNEQEDYGQTQYLFPSERTYQPIAQKSLSEAKWRLKNPDKVTNQKYTPEQIWLKDIEDWSPHDLRRTVRTGLSRLGCPSEVAEAVLGHSRKGIEGTYDLHKYENECAVWLQRWADHLDGLISG
ncbi:tyrosine-type recombinase/integrase [Acinetobacter baumannii]